MATLTTAIKGDETAGALLEQVETHRLVALPAAADERERSSLGQFFTPANMAAFMAGFFDPLPSEIRLLDPGAGTGALCSAFALHALKQEPGIKSLDITAWEIDSKLIPFLQDTLAMINRLCCERGVDFHARIEEGDFIQHAPPSLENGPLFGQGSERYNCVFMNPPYKKIQGTSLHRRILSRLGLETGNLYTAFLWLAAKDLELGGQLVSIHPRSFANGPYFYPFRKAFLSEMTLKRAHLFNSRTNAFKDDAVLQENVIIHAVKGGVPDAVRITASDHIEDLAKERLVPQSELIDPADPQQFIHLVADESGALIRRQMRQFHCTLDDLNLGVSTGRVVDFRAKSFLQREADANTVPLIYPGHFKGKHIKWPRENFKKCNHFTCCPDSESLLVEAGDYVLVKRFTAKEERRRVLAAVLSKAKLPTEAYALENHLNYFHHNGKGLPRLLAQGLSGFLNSTLFDEYFRQFNGHTQVNATDLRTMRYPCREDLVAFGRKIEQKDLTQEALDQLFARQFIPMADAQPNPVRAKKKIEQALDILKQLDVPRAQQNERCALTLLALLGLKPTMPWTKAATTAIGITEMMDWFRDYYGVTYKPNTRETVRRQTVHQFVEMGIVIPNPDEPDRPPNSPNFRYIIESSALALLKTYGKRDWKKGLLAYTESIKTLRVLHHKEREMNRIEVRLPDGRKKWLSGGGQNILIKAVIDEFCPRYTPGGTVCYLRDISWETDVWLAENPTHLIHFNGEKFLRPYAP